MNRAVVGGAMVMIVATISVPHYLTRTPQTRGDDSARTAQLLERMDALERSIAALATAQSANVSSAPMPRDVPGTSSEQKPPPAAELAAREVAIRAGNAVVDRAIDAARWSTADVAAFETATASLSGAERAEIHARLSAAINQDRVQVDGAARPF